MWLDDLDFSRYDDLHVDFNDGRIVGIVTSSLEQRPDEFDEAMQLESFWVCERKSQFGLDDDERLLGDDGRRSDDEMIEGD